MSEYIPEECPMCDRVGTVVFEKLARRAICSDGRTTLYEHHGCYCKGCGESFVTAKMMSGNLHRMREAFEKLEVAE